MTGLDERPFRARLADRLPWKALFTVIIAVIQAVDLGMRLRSRLAGCRPTPAGRGTNTAYINAEFAEPTTTTSSAGNVVWLSWPNRTGWPRAGSWG